MKRVINSNTHSYKKTMSDIPDKRMKARTTLLRVLMECVDWDKVREMENADLIIPPDDALEILK